MKVVKSNSEQLTLSMIKGGRTAPDALHSIEMDLLREVTNAFSVVHGGQYRTRHHSKMA